MIRDGERNRRVSNPRLKNRSGACRVIASPRIESKLLSMAQKQRRRPQRQREVSVTVGEFPARARAESAGRIKGIIFYVWIKLPEAVIGLFLSLFFSLALSRALTLCLSLSLAGRVTIVHVPREGIGPGFSANPEPR